MPLSTALSVDDLRAFYLVNEAGGISAASRKFGLSKATLSRALNRLEDRAKAPIFDRVGTGLQLTAAGAALVDAAAAATHAASEAEDILRAAHDKPQGPLRIAASALSAQQLLGPVLAKLRLDHPDVRAAVTVTGHGPDPLAEDLDVVLRLGRPKEPYLIARRIVASPLRLYASAIATKDLDLTDEVVVRGLGRVHIGVPGSPTDWVLTSNDHHEIRFEDEPIMSVGDPTVALGVLRGGCGLAFLPAIFGDGRVKQGDFARALPDFEGPMIEIYTTYPPRRASVPAVRAFIDELVDVTKRMTIEFSKSDDG